MSWLGDIVDFVADILNLEAGYTQDNYSLTNTNCYDIKTTALNQTTKLLGQGISYADASTIIKYKNSTTYGTTKRFVKKVREGEFTHPLPVIKLEGNLNIDVENIDPAIEGQFNTTPEYYGVADTQNNPGLYIRSSVLENIYTQLSNFTDWGADFDTPNKLKYLGGGYTFDQNLAAVLPSAQLTLTLTDTPPPPPVTTPPTPAPPPLPATINLPFLIDYTPPVAGQFLEYFIVVMDVSPYVYIRSRNDILTDLEKLIFNPANEDGTSNSIYEIIPSIPLRRNNVNVTAFPADEKEILTKQLKRFNIDYESVLENYESSMKDGDFDDYLDNLQLEFKANVVSDIPINKHFLFSLFNSFSIIPPTVISGRTLHHEYKVDWNYGGTDGDFKFYKLARNFYTYQQVLDNPDEHYSKAYYSNPFYLDDSNKVRRDFYQTSCHLEADDTYTATTTQEIKDWLITPTTTYLRINKKSKSIKNIGTDRPRMVLYGGSSYQKDDEGNLQAAFNKNQGTFAPKVQLTGNAFTDAGIKALNGLPGDNLTYYLVQSGGVAEVQIQGLKGGQVITDATTLKNKYVKNYVFNRTEFVGVPLSSKIFDSDFSIKNKYLLVESNMYFVGYIAYSKYIEYSGSQRFLLLLVTALEILSIISLIAGNPAGLTLKEIAIKIADQLIYTYLATQVIKILAKYIAPELAALIVIYLTFTHAEALGFDRAKLITTSLNNMVVGLTIKNEDERETLETLQKEIQIEQEAMGKELEELLNKVGLDRYGNRIDPLETYHRLKVLYGKGSDYTNMQKYLEKQKYAYRVYGVKSSKYLN